MQNWSNTALSTQTNTIVTVILTVAQVIYALPFRENMYIRTNSRRIQGKPPHAQTYIKWRHHIAVSESQNIQRFLRDLGK